MQIESLFYIRKEIHMRTEQILSYKELCTELQIEYKEHKARELQLNQLKDKYDIEKLKNQRGKYIIHRELSKEEQQYIQDSKNYSNYITNLLLNIIAEEHGATCTFTLRELRERTGMVNEEYFPIKYHKHCITIKTPANYTGNVNSTKQEWIGISDKMDEAIINYCLTKLKKKGIIEYYNSYKFYKIEPQTTNTTIFNPPHILTEEELSDFLQFQIDTLKELGLKSKQDLHYCSEIQRERYYNIMNQYVCQKGYTNYARAITIIKPKELHKVVGYFAEKFNALQVQKYLKSKRFKTIPPFLHETMVEQVIERR